MPLKKVKHEKPRYPVIAVLAFDWAFYEEQYDCANPSPFKLMNAWTIGLLIHEDEDKLVIASSYFPLEEHVRHTTVISRVSIIKRIDYD